MKTFLIKNTVAVQFCQTSSGGEKIIIQVGGKGNNAMWAVGGGRKNHMEQYGGSGNNTMSLGGARSDDVLAMYGGPSNDTLRYELTAGTDIVTINAGAGYDTLTIETNQKSFTIKDYYGRVLFKTGTGGSTITITGIEYTKVIGDKGETLWEYRADVNQDGVLDIRDAVIAIQVLAGVAPAQPASQDADIDGDGRVGLAEAIFILQKVAGMR